MFNIKLAFNSENHTIPISYERGVELMNQLPKEIGKQIFTQYYIVTSDVTKDSFNDFIKYLRDSVEPAIDINNMADFYLLSQEFGILKNLFKEIDKNSLNLSILSSDRIKDKSTSESYISSHLDDIIENHGQELMKAPITSLYNIFYHRDRVLENHQKAYDLIIRASLFNINTNSDLFTLLESLDMSKLDKQSQIESLEKSEERFRLCPKIDKRFINEYAIIVNEKIPALEEEKRDLQNIIDQTKNDIQTAENKYENIVDLFLSMGVKENESVNGIYHNFKRQPCIMHAKLIIQRL